MTLQHTRKIKSHMEGPVTRHCYITTDLVALSVLLERSFRRSILGDQIRGGEAKTASGFGLGTKSSGGPDLL